MVLWITVTVPLDNLSEEQIYICLVSIALAVLKPFIISLVSVAAITTAATIYLLPAPLAFSKLDFLADIPILLFIPPATSLSRTRWYSPHWIGTWWRRGDGVPRSAERSIRKVPVEILTRSMQRARTNRIPIGSSVMAELFKQKQKI